MKTLLHVGCGFNKKDATTKGFKGEQWRELRFDIDESVNPDIIGSMTDMSGVDSESIDAIFSSHNIEHLYPHEVPIALKEFMRVLSHDGFLVITCPDLKSTAKLVAADKLTEAAYESPAGPIAPLDILYGYRKSMALGNLYMAHRCGFTKKVLHNTLISAGFGSVATSANEDYFELWSLASKREIADADLKKLFQGYTVR
tara:strand:- start:1342 stop:1941 length:600 start_codon:yes stop_codon:yes gene_type:complete